ncbi:MAG: ACP S-malonyltransferase [Deltaproteobacteria bacterium]|nr:ACP S-malonyltransferase [Deltaproteobacteria bacterium]
MFFAGQGSEVPRMGLELAASFPRARGLLELASEGTKVDLFRLLARGGRDLDRTEVLQPAMVAVCLGAWLAAEEVGARPSFVVGHSLGELSAWSAGGFIAPEVAVELAIERGELMARAARARPGGMIALKAASASTVEAALDVGRAHGWLDIGAHNGPTQWVLSGAFEALDAVARSFETSPVPTTGPWHSSGMASAREPFLRALSQVHSTDGSASLISSSSGSLATAAELPELLADQLTRPVRWADAMKTLLGQGVERFVIAGPSKVMRALIRSNVPADCRIESIEDPRDVRRLEGTWV